MWRSTLADSQLPFINANPQFTETETSDSKDAPKDKYEHSEKTLVLDFSMKNQISKDSVVYVKSVRAYGTVKEMGEKVVVGIDGVDTSYEVSNILSKL